MSRQIKSNDNKLTFVGKTRIEKLSLPKVDPATAANADAGKVKLIMGDDGIFYSKDENGVIGRFGLAQIITPTAVSPTEGETLGNTTITLEASDFNPMYSYPHVSSDWIVYNSSDQEVFSSLDDTSNLTSITVTGLSLNTPYKWKVRYKDSSGVYSDWSVVYNFTTLSS